MVNVQHHCLETVSDAMHTGQLGLGIQGLPLPGTTSSTRGMCLTTAVKSAPEMTLRWNFFPEPVWPGNFVPRLAARIRRARAIRHPSTRVAHTGSLSLSLHQGMPRGNDHKSADTEHQVSLRPWHLNSSLTMPKLNSFQGNLLPHLCFHSSQAHELVDNLITLMRIQLMMHLLRGND